MRIDRAAVLGVGMTRFRVWKERSNLDLAREAGLAALADAGLRLSDVDEAWVGYMAPQPMLGVRVMKEFGLTGLPVTHVENASATGLAALREAAWAVSSGRCRVAMAIGFDKMSELAAGGQTGRGIGRDSIDSVILPAAYFALWATRRMHERGTKPAHFAAIAAKNWNHGALNPLADRQPEHEITPDAVLASPMIAEPLTAMMACPVDDGAACVIVAHPDVVRDRQPGRPVARRGSGGLRHRTSKAGRRRSGWRRGVARRIRRGPLGAAWPGSIGEDATVLVDIRALHARRRVVSAVRPVVVAVVLAVVTGVRVREDAGDRTPGPAHSPNAVMTGWAACRWV